VLQSGEIEQKIADEEVPDQVDAIQGVGIAFGTPHNSFQ